MFAPYLLTQRAVSIVDDDELMRDAPLAPFKRAGLPARVSASAEGFLASEITARKPLASPCREIPGMQTSAISYLSMIARLAARALPFGSTQLAIREKGRHLISVWQLEPKK
jgi:hypothetical protein